MIGVQRDNEKNYLPAGLLYGLKIILKRFDLVIFISNIKVDLAAVKRYHLDKSPSKYKLLFLNAYKLQLDNYGRVLNE